MIRRHLSSEDTVAAIEGTLDPVRAAHLDGCDECQREVAALGRILRDVVAAADPAEPSPLFWEHLSARVHDAVGAEAPSRLPAWRHWWQPVLGLAAASLFVVWLIGRDQLGAPPPGPAIAESASAVVGAADAPWDALVELAADLSVDEVDGAMPLRLDTVVLFDELTPEEQQTLSELLRAELKELE